MAENILLLIITYLLVVNLAAFVMYGVDKGRAKSHAWRIPEATLITAAWIGGAYGAALGMKVWRHKTQKIKFQIFVPLAVIAWTVLLLYGAGRFLSWLGVG